MSGAMSTRGGGSKAASSSSGMEAPAAQVREDDEINATKVLAGLHMAAVPAVPIKRGGKIQAGAAAGMVSAAPSQLEIPAPSVADEPKENGMPLTIFPRRKGRVQSAKTMSQQAASPPPKKPEGAPVMVTIEGLSAYFDMPLIKAASEMGICATALKKVCRRLGVTKWPYKASKMMRNRAGGGEQQALSGESTTASPNLPASSVPSSLEPSPNLKAMSLANKMPHIKTELQSGASRGTRNTQVASCSSSSPAASARGVEGRAKSGRDRGHMMRPVPHTPGTSDAVQRDEVQTMARGGGGQVLARRSGRARKVMRKGSPSSEEDVAVGGRGAKKGPNAVNTAGATGRGNKIAAAAVAAGSDAGGKGDFKIFPRRKFTQSSNSKELRLDGKPLVVTLDILESCYDLPLYAAAAKLGICITAIKKVCRKLGVTKWPYREMRLQREGGAASAGVADPGELESDVGESSNNEDDEEGDAGVVDDGGSDHEEFSRVDSSGSAVGIQGWSVLMAAAHRISEEVEKQEQASLKAEKATAKEEGVLDPPPPDPQQATMAASVQTTTDAEQEPQDGGPEPLDAST